MTLVSPPTQRVVY